MPSPFPGMDPFLEQPEIFPDLHDSMIVALRESLNARLPEPYYAKIGRRVWVEVSQRSIGPDVNVLRPKNGPLGGGESAGDGVAVASVPRTQPIVVHVPHEEIRETFLEIYTRQGGERLVTSVEVLSPANKSPGDHGQALYQQKQREVLNSQVHLVEIDLLRGGIHTTAVPLEHALKKTGPFDYHVCIRHFDNLENYFVYPIQLQDRLPEVAVPLLPGHTAVPIDLQAMLDHCYDTGAYRRHVRYADTTPVPPLRTEQAEWAAPLLRAQGLLPPA